MLCSSAMMDVLEVLHDLQPSSLSRGVFLLRIRHVNEELSSVRSQTVEPRKHFSMRGNSLCLLLLFIILTKAYVKSCKYWCKMDNHRYYCCPSGKSDSSTEHSWHSFFFPWFWFGFVEPHMEHSWHELMKPKKPENCPPLRTHCPRTYEWYKPPIACHSDHECDEGEKCCYDVCLEHKTCKNAE